MLARMGFRTLVTLAVVGVLAVLIGVFSQRTAQADPQVPTSAVVDPSGIAPRIECKWELPDMDSAATGIQYTTTPGHLHDDEMAVVPDADNDPANGTQVPCDLPAGTADPPAMPGGVRHMVQVKPNLEDLPEERRIQLWAAVDHPTGIGSITQVFWEVFHPDGTKKTQVHGTQVPLAECASLGTGTGPDGSMFEAAVHTGQLSAAAVDDPNRGIIAKCQQQEKALWYAEFSLSKDQQCGEYEIRATAVGVGGTTATLSNYLDVPCIWAIAIDFNQVNWGPITPGVTDWVSGDLVWDVPADNRPTVKNIGNDGMGLKLHFSKMVGATFGKEISEFDGCFGRSASTLRCVDPIVASTPADFGTGTDQVLCANEIGKLDLSIHPPFNLPGDTYRGTLDVMGFGVPGLCKGNVHP